MLSLRHFMMVGSLMDCVLVLVLFLIYRATNMITAQSTAVKSSLKEMEEQVWKLRKSPVSILRNIFPPIDRFIPKVPDVQMELGSTTSDAHNLIKRIPFLGSFKTAQEEHKAILVAYRRIVDESLAFNQKMVICIPWLGWQKNPNTTRHSHKI